MGTGQWILIYVVFMVVLFLPQILAGRKRKKAQETMLDSLKIGDETLKDIRFELEELSKSKVKIILKSVVLEEQNTNNKKYKITKRMTKK